MGKKKKNNTKKKSEEKKTDIQEIVDNIENDKKNKETVEERIEKEITKDEIKEEKPIKKNDSKFTNFVLVLLLIISLIYFFSSLINKTVTNINGIISILSITLFTICFVITGIKYKSKHKKLFIISSLCLALFFLINIGNSFNIIKVDSINKVEDFTNKSVTEVIKWAKANNIDLIQEYEYSDMISEYKIISQDVKSGTKLNDIKELTISISEGPNPYKEVIIPNMVSWDSQRVIDFVNNNYLNNVKVSFELSDEKEDTVIEQDKVGNYRRNEEIKLVFSSGEEIGYEEVKLIDFTNKNKFESEFYLKQHHLNYKFEEDFSKDIKKGYVTRQNIVPGETVKIEDEEVVLTLSKGPEIKVPDLTKMSNTDLMEWIITNKLKVKFSDKYDENVKKNDIIEANYKKGDIISQGTIVEVTLSKGQLKMKKFDSLSEFKEWADKYSIKYEEQYEFSSTVKAGEVISYSYKTGDTIKNNDVIIIKISDGEEIEVPNLIGLSKSEIESKLNKISLNYNFVYKYNDDVDEGTSYKQSISKGSKVSSGTTITITISKGSAPKTANRESNNSNNSNSSNNNNNNNSNNNNNTNNNTPSCDTSKGDNLNIQPGNNGSQTKAMISQMNPNHKITYNFVSACPNGSTDSGTVCSISGGSDGEWVSYCTNIKITIVE